MDEIDFTADSPEQLYRILKDFPNQDDSEEILYEKECLFNMACEALRPLTDNSSNKTKLELLQLALDYPLQFEKQEWRQMRMMGKLDFRKFAVYVHKDYRVDYKDTKMFFSDKIIDLSEPNCVNHFLDVGVKCLEQHLGSGNLSQIHENGEFDELVDFCKDVMAIEGISTRRIPYLLRKFLEKLSEEE